MNSRKRTFLHVATFVLLLAGMTGCESTDGGGGGTPYYGTGFYDPWYYGEYYHDYDGVVLPPGEAGGPRPSHPIATPPPGPRPTPMPSMPMAAPRGGRR